MVPLKTMKADDSEVFKLVVKKIKIAQLDGLELSENSHPSFNCTIFS